MRKVAHELLISDAHMLCIQNLSIFAQGNQILNDFSCAFLPGSITYITGPNGVGKTALLRLIAGIKKLTHGKVTYHDRDIADIRKPYALYIGHKLGLDPQLTVAKQLEAFTQGGMTQMLVPAAIEYLKLHDVLDTPISLLSAGYAKKVALSKCLLSDIDLWLLDEVEANLDEANTNVLHKLLASKADAGGIVFIASHGPTRMPKAQKLNLAYWSLSVTGTVAEETTMRDIFATPQKVK